jgi:NAD(P)-dependent dehydrogenase (short-subunit alcohol dehydrogenase family)
MCVGIHSMDPVSWEGCTKMTDSDYAGKVALVTGGGSGIGAACALLLAERGARVLVVGLDKIATQLVADEIGDGARAFSADVTRPDDCKAMVAEAVRIFGRLDIAVNSAGIPGPRSRTADYPLDGWAEVIAVNLSGVFYCMQAEIAMMLSCGGGAIVNVGSVLSGLGYDSAVAYVSAKHGVLGLTKTAAIEYARHGIRINSVGSGFSYTRAMTTATPKVIKAMTERQPLGRLADASEIAELVAFLASEKASNITGSHHLADGGYSAV